MTFGSLFAGIGGFDLGFERAGMECKWQVEIDPYCQRVLAKHWPSVRRHDDVRTFPPDDGTDWRVDVICGGFPCQDISNAGQQAGITGQRSGLWTEFARIIRVLRPRFVVVENVAALLSRGMGVVLGDLAKSGYDAEWQQLPAAAFGAPHLRHRIFIVAHDDRHDGTASRPREVEAWAANVAVSGGSSPLANARCSLLEEAAIESLRCTGGDQWATEPAVGRVADGIPDRVDRLTGLGNAVVPQVAEWIGRRIMENAK